MDKMRCELMTNIGAAIFISDDLSTRLNELIVSADERIAEIEDIQEESGFEKGETPPNQ
jgi:hypothetical protein